MLTSFTPTQRCTNLLAAVVSSSMVILTADFSPRAGKFMPSVVWLCQCASLATLYISAPDEGFQWNSFSLPLYVSTSFAVNCCCLESLIVAAGGSLDFLIGAPGGVVGRAPRIDMAIASNGSIFEWFLL